MDALKIFGSPWLITATFPEIVNGHLLRSIVLKCIPNLKFVALLALKIVGVTKKPAVPRPTLPFEYLKNFVQSLDTPFKVTQGD